MDSDERSHRMTPRERWAEHERRVARIRREQARRKARAGIGRRFRLIAGEGVPQETTAAPSSPALLPRGEKGDRRDTRRPEGDTRREAWAQAVGLVIGLLMFAAVGLAIGRGVMQVFGDSARQGIVAESP
jgi:hypothetical protein